MKRYTFTGKLVNYSRKNSSVCGNPCYSGTFENAEGETITGKTASDASCAYGFLNKINNNREITYHETRNGNIIIDRIRILEA